MDTAGATASAVILGEPTGGGAQEAAFGAWHPRQPWRSRLGPREALLSSPAAGGLSARQQPACECREERHHRGGLIPPHQGLGRLGRPCGPGVQGALAAGCCGAPEPSGPAAPAGAGCVLQRWPGPGSEWPGLTPRRAGGCPGLSRGGVARGHFLALTPRVRVWAPGHAGSSQPPGPGPLSGPGTTAGERAWHLGRVPPLTHCKLRWRPGPPLLHLPGLTPPGKRPGGRSLRSRPSWGGAAE